MAVLALAFVTFRTGQPPPVAADTRHSAFVDAAVLDTILPSYSGKAPDYLEPSTIPLLGPDKDAITAVWGDSHAMNLFDGVVSRSERYGLSYKFFICWSTLPVLGTARKPENEQHNEKLCDYLINDPKVKNVILAANWTAYLEGDRYFGHRLGRTPMFDFHGSPVSQYEKYTIFEQQLRQTVTKLTAGGKHVFICTPVPVYTFNVPRGIREMERQGRDPNAALSYSMADYLNMNGRLLAIFKSVSDTIPHTYIIPIHLDLFKNDRSILEENGSSLYEDAHHLNGLGSQKIGDRISKFLTSNGA